MRDMNRTIFWRLMWKEYRLQRAFWIAMTVLALILMFSVWEFIDQPRDRAQQCILIAFGIPVLYGLGCASTTFAGEHDAETYEFQRSLPITAMNVFWSKITQAVSSTAAMCVFLFMLSVAISGGGGLDARETMLPAAYGLASICLFMSWGTFFSLLMKRPLLAAVLAVSCASLTLSLLVNSFADRTQLDFTTTLIIAVVALAIALVDYWLGRSWFIEKARWALRTKDAAVSTRAEAEALADYLSAPKRWNMILRLGWQHWRQSAWMLIVVAVMPLPLAFCAFVIWQHTRPGRYEFLVNQPDWQVNVVLCSVLALAMPPLLGTFTFLGDQRRRNYRFFAERGIGPRTVWLSRMWPWLVIGPCVLALLTVLFIPIFYSWRWEIQSWLALPEISPNLWLLLSYFVLSVCAGQLCSMFFRSGLLAGLFGLVLGGVVGFWAALMWLWDINWMWSIAPIPVALILATWLRAPDWLLDRNRPRAWLWPVMVLVVPAIILLTAVPLYRVYQIPAVDPGFSVEEFTRPLTPEEEATCRILVRAIDLIEWPPRDKKDEADSEAFWRSIDEQKENVYSDSTIRVSLTAKQIDWIKSNGEAIAAFIEASNGSLRIREYSPSRGRWYPVLSHGAHDLLVESAMLLETEGKLDEALDRYLAVIRISRQTEEETLEHFVYTRLPFWATLPKQTPERIKGALQKLKPFDADAQADDREIKMQYVGFREALTKGFFTQQKQRYLPLWTIVWEHLPSERARALRLLNLLTRDQLDRVRQAESDAEQGKPVKFTGKGREYFYRWEEYSRERAYALHEAVNIPPLRYADFSNFVINSCALLENHRRATTILFALQAYKLEHGEYPKTLDELAGTYFDQVPIDLYSGEPYLYYPEGLKTWMQGPGMNFELLSSGTDRPFIWSTSQQIHVIPDEKQFLSRYLVYDKALASNKDNAWPFTWAYSVYEVLLRGHCFVLP
jgi:hypothetical protein